MEEKTKFCKFCGEKIPEDAIICTKCGRQVENIKSNSEHVIINNNVNTNAQSTSIGGFGRPINKWISLCLCIFLGYFGAHKFYEGKTGVGILYLFTFGLFGVGWFFDIITIVLKPNPYFVMWR